MALSLRVVFPFAFGYFVSYLSRVVNAVIAPELTAELGLDAADLGLLTSAYFFLFSAFQLPLGIMLDRLGPRRTNATLLTISVAGALIFASADGMVGLTIGRGLIGLGVSACLMGPFVAYRTWFPKGRLPLVSGIQMAAGGLGALTGTVPVEAALSVAGWRGVFVGLAVVTAAVAVLIILVVPKDNVQRRSQSLWGQLRGFGAVFTSPLFIRIAPLTTASQGTFVGVQSLWVGPWLADVARFDRGGVADTLFLIAAAMVGGFLMWGAIAERVGRRGIRTISVALVGVAFFLAIQAVLISRSGPAAAIPIWLAFGFFGTSNVLCYSMLGQSFPAEMAGRVYTSLNVVVFTGAFAVQWGVGAIVNQWDRLPTGGYPAAAYQTAFAVLLVLELASVAWYALYRRNDIKT